LGHQQLLEHLTAEPAETAVDVRLGGINGLYTVLEALEFDIIDGI
jgi:hypothetical protein